MVDRDEGAEKWGCLEIYLDKGPARKPELRKRIVYTPIALKPLQELIASFENPAEPIDLEKSCLWIYAFEHFEREIERSGKAKAIKRETLKFLYDNASSLANSPKH